MTAPFEWGKSDCLIVPADLAKAMTGADPMRGLRGYGTETEAFKALLKLGFKTVEDALEAVFPEVPAVAARRGDCGIYDQVVDGKPQIATMIVIQGHMAFGRNAAGHVFRPIGHLRRLFAIGDLEEPRSRTAKPAGSTR